MMPYKRVYSEKIDTSKNRYAYNSSIAGYQKQNWQHAHAGNVLFKSLPSEIQEANIHDLRDGNERQLSSNIFGVKKSDKVYAISSFGVLSLALRQRNLNKDLFSSEAFKEIISVVNAVPLEKFGANFVNQLHGGTNRVQTPKRTCLSTTDIVESCKISPPEKNRRTAERGAVIANELKDVAAAHNENIFKVLGNVHRGMNIPKYQAFLHVRQMFHFQNWDQRKL